MKLRLNAYGNRRMLSGNPVVQFGSPRGGKTSIKLTANLTQEQLALLGPTFTEPATEGASSKKKNEAALEVADSEEKSEISPE